jgi:O-antigen/teichoic acid export membrane protein
MAITATALSPLSALRQFGGRAAGRMSWGVADQAVSSLTNFAVSIYVARTLGAVQLGAFSLAYVTYGFALNAGRELATDPLMVRFSAKDETTWRRAVSESTGTSAVVGVAVSLGLLVTAAILHGATRGAYLALAITMPGLLIQDSWRYAFFALGRGVRALLNDLAWAIVLLPTLYLLDHIGHGSVFWFVLAWGGGAAVGAAIGPL